MIENHNLKGMDNFTVGILGRCYLDRVFAGSAHMLRYGDRELFQIENDYIEGFECDGDEKQNSFRIIENIITIRPKRFKKKR
jgi:hypothetical protein